jgi:hypothetical protein
MPREHAPSAARVALSVVVAFATLTGCAGFTGPSESEVAAMPLTDVLALADGGQAHAQFMLGMLYADGRGIEADSALARSWFELAAAGGSALAQERLEKLQK